MFPGRYISIEVAMASELINKKCLASLVFQLCFPAKLCSSGNYSEILFDGCYPGGTSGKAPACQCRKHTGQGLDPWIRKISKEEAWQFL